MMGNHNYRPDIDGLRAFAVLAVVLYHAGVPVLPGGFVGVDIFFVISGYLITGIIAREIAENSFSIAGFYERRARRILPALFAMLAICTLLAGLILLPFELQDFGDSLAAATLFVSNVYFWKTTDYFASAAHLKPLLHTWSLAVEEQFYIVLPLLLLALSKAKAGSTVRWLLALSTASFALSVWAVSAKPAAAFYLLPTRFWELMMGGLLALGVFPAPASRKAAEAMAAAGALLMMASVFFLSVASPFPGPAALLPVAGAALIIHAGSSTRETLVARALSLRPVVFVGLVSYSLYLWHWPVMTFHRIWRGEPATAVEMAGLVALSFVLAILSWRYVEKPFRERRFAPTRAVVFRYSAATMVVAVALGSYARLSGGWPERHPGYAPPAIAGLERMNLNTCFLQEDQAVDTWAAGDCSFGSSDAPLIFLWGDSFAAHLVPGLIDELDGRFRLVQFTASGCPPVIDTAPSNRPHCRAFNERALEEIERLGPKIVLASARWDLYLPRTVDRAAIQSTLDRVAANNRDVIAVGRSPSFDFASPYDFVYRKGLREASPNPMPVIASSDSQASWFEPAPLFCRGQRCELEGDEGFLFFDGGHYSVEGSRRVARALMTKLEAALDKPELAATAGQNQ